MSAQPINNITQDFSQINASSQNGANNNNNSINKFNVKHNPCLLLDALNTCHIATQNIAEGLRHLHKQLAIFSLLDNPPPSTTRIDIMGLAHTGLSHKQAKHVFTYDHFNNPDPDFPKVESFTGFKPYLQLHLLRGWISRPK